MDDKIIDKKNKDSLFVRIFYFFPLQLLFAHLKKNHILLIVWLVLFLYVTQNIGGGFGVPFLFLYPEFLGKVDFTSHLILGFSCGGFIMGFNIASYILNSYSFPFIATLSRPFFKYCLNNFILPIGFLLVYIWQMYSFQKNAQLDDILHVLTNIGGFVLGNVLFLIISITYFFSTSKSVFELLHLSDVINPHKKSSNLMRGFFHRFDHWTKHMFREPEFRVETYLANFFKISLARESKHYDAKTLRMVFSQNHINASLFEALVVVTVVLLGIFRENEFFQIPAGASIFLVFSMLLMMFSAIYSWFKQWSTFIIAMSIILFTFLTDRNLETLNRATGIDYTYPKASYSSYNLYNLANDSNAFRKDISHHLEILKTWKAKNQTTDPVKPKIVFLNTSGGGLRAALWTYYTLAYIDSALDGRFFNKIHLISGSSGGAFGAAYYREMYLREDGNRKKLTSNEYIDNISKDLLNSITYTIAVHDLYFRFDNYLSQDGIIKDRGYVFEKRFNKNTGNVLNKTLKDYVEPEQKSEIPLMIISPTIINDARRLLIASQPISFLANKSSFDKQVNNQYLVENIEFTKLFKNQNPYNLNYVSALRMNGTFPYILPAVSLPSEPVIEVMDAGLRDNFGLETTLSYLSHFKTWIKENTSGIVIVQIRDNFKNTKIDNNPPSGFEEIVSPLSAIYGNVIANQGYNQDNLIVYSSLWFNMKVDVVNIQLENPKDDRISLSWHLTNREKKKIIKAVKNIENEKAIFKLTSLLYHN